MQSGAKWVGVAYEGRSAVTAVCRLLGDFPFQAKFSSAGLIYNVQ